MQWGTHEVRTAVHAGHDDSGAAHRHETGPWETEVALDHEFAVVVEELPNPPAGVQRDNLVSNDGDARNDVEFAGALATAADRSNKSPVVVEHFELRVAVQDEVADFLAPQETNALSFDHPVPFGIADAHDLAQDEFHRLDRFRASAG